MDSNDKTIEVQNSSQMLSPQPHLEVLSHRETDEGLWEYRLLVDGKDIKYAAIDYEDSKYSYDDMIAHLKIIWRAGDWDKVFLCGYYKIAVIDELSWFGPPATPTVDGYLRQVVDYSDLSIVDKLSPNEQVVTCSQFPGRPLVFRFAAFHGDLGPTQKEAEIHGLLRDAPDDAKDIAPIFVAHVRMKGEIIGFLLEHVTGRCFSNSLKDFKACRKALQQLHSLGIKHGSVSHDTVRIRTRNDGTALEYGQDRAHKAFFSSFPGSTKCTCKKELEKDFDDLRQLFPKAAMDDEEME